MTDGEKWAALRERLEMIWVADLLNEARGLRRVKLSPADLLQWMRDLEMNRLDEQQEKADE